MEHSSAGDGAKASKPAASAIAVGTKLNGAQIKSFLSGKFIDRISDGRCLPFQIDFEINGSVKVTCNVNSDNGKWFINGDTVGLEMDNWWGGDARYYNITKVEGDSVVATAHSGSFTSKGQKWAW